MGPVIHPVFKTQHTQTFWSCNRIQTTYGFSLSHWIYITTEMKPDLICHNRMLMINCNIMSISKQPVTKVNSQNWICSLMRVCNKYSERTKSQDFCGPVNWHFRDTILFGQSMKWWFAWTKFGSCLRVTVVSICFDWCLLCYRQQIIVLCHFLYNTETHGFLGRGESQNCWWHLWKYL
jgi:hypothetical protein